jgi:Carboxypeptidase regulatory-like domain
MRTCVRWAFITSSLFFLAAPVRSQSLGNAGTVDGSVVDQSGAAIPKAEIQIHNPVSGYSQSTIAANDGSFHLVNIPPNQYHLEIKKSGFTVYSQDVTIRNSLPVQTKAILAVAGSNTTVTVEGAAEALEIDPSAHVDADRVQLSKIPALDPGADLSQAIVYSTGGVAADGNGFFHPLGDHAQVGFVIDGQPITDQQSKVFSTQLPVSAVQSMELTTGTPHIRPIGTFSKENSDNLRHDDRSG